MPKIPRLTAKQAEKMLLEAGFELLSSRTKLIIQKSARKADITVKPCVNNFVSLLTE